MKKKRTTGDIVFDVLNYTFMIVLCLTTIYPFWNLFTQSIASINVPTTELYLFPPETTFENYRRVLENDDIIRGFAVTIFRTVVGTVLTLLVTLMAAYVLSKRYYPNRNLWTSLIVFTMFFNGGMIPTYLVVKGVGLLNSIWALILPGLASAYNIVIARNYFMSLPESLEESARIDGANDIRILFSIIMPLSKPIIATLALWVAVDNWNAWFDCLLYITNSDIQVLQLVMRRIVLEGSAEYVNISTVEVSSNQAIMPESIKAATIMVTTIPILIVYPFIQKYFVKGVMVGSLKG
ncbi:MAG: carbohydrate ABC transporter permease [Candidatus Merdivicinus sp.]|jgi:putative aldouronate transport system permease protein